MQDKPISDPVQPLEVLSATGPKFPDITVQLSGQDGNAFMIIGRVAKAIRRAKTAAAANAFAEEAMSGDYDHVIQTVMRWVDVE